MHSVWDGCGHALGPTDVIHGVYAVIIQMRAAEATAATSAPSRPAAIVVEQDPTAVKRPQGKPAHLTTCKQRLRIRFCAEEDRTGSTTRALTLLEKEILDCSRCEALRSYCAQVATEKRRAYRDWDYWGRPVPGFGDPKARILIVGLAPAAHGANRTGHMFTGDRSGNFLYAALHRAGLANQARSTDRDDGLMLRGVFVTAALRCAPPANRPTAGQITKCLPYLLEELHLLRPKVMLCLGSIGWNAALAALREGDHDIPSPRPRFGHAAECGVGKMTLLGCYHVSQQNTFTDRLTEPMIDEVLARARSLAGLET